MILSLAAEDRTAVDVDRTAGAANNTAAAVTGALAGNCFTRNCTAVQVGLVNIDGAGGVVEQTAVHKGAVNI